MGFFGNVGRATEIIFRRWCFPAGVALFLLADMAFFMAFYRHQSYLVFKIPPFVVYLTV